MSRRGLLVSVVVVAALANVGLAISPLRYPSAFLLLWVVPGVAWALVLADRGCPGVEEAAVGFGLGLATVGLVTLLLHYIPGALGPGMQMLGVDLIVLALVLAAACGRAEGGRPRAGSWRLALPLLAVLLVATSLRLTFLGYSEFQGDEGTVMWRAGHALLGDDSQLFYHQKGPGEVLLPIAMWNLSGTLDEGQARLPYAFAGILGVLAVYQLGRRWMNSVGGLAAGLLLAINGYFVGFGRIVQYQSLVLAMTGLGMLALWRWSQGASWRWLGSAAVLLAFGLLAHYDAVLCLPAAAYLVGRRVLAQEDRRQVAVQAAAAAGLGLAIALGFYVPFALHPSFGSTLDYLGGARVGTGGILHNNLLSQLPLSTFYNSSYYLISVALLVVVAALSPLRRGWLAAAGVCVAAVALVLNVEALGLLAGPLLAGLLALLIIAPSTSPHARWAWLWFGTPFVVYYFLVWDPRTHVLNVFPAGVLLAAFALVRLLGMLPPAGRRAATPLLVSAFVVLACYPYVMFVQHEPEVKRNWPDAAPALYWTPEGDLPLFGYFGFPYRAGWKAVGTLFEDGVLTGVYGSNEEQQVAGWYLRGVERSYCAQPDWYLIAENVQDEVAVDWQDLESGYGLWGWIEVAGQRKLSIYGRHLTGWEAFAIYLDDYEPVFDARTTPSSLVAAAPAEEDRVSYTLGGEVVLLAYRINQVEPSPGGVVEVVLYWEALRPIDGNYQVFTHLYDGAMRGQHDGSPACGLWPTVMWEPGQVVRDEHRIAVEPSAPAGGIPLLVGMYDLATGDRLSVEGPDGESLGSAVPLGLVTLE
jgi:4-amino-4-deoxy-L-arabinose transferase-like glycosyltransferase